MDVTNLRDLIPVCGDKLDGSIPIRDANECKWTTVVWAVGGPIDCGAVQACMAAIVAGINNNLATLNGTTSNHESRIIALEVDTHTHSNFAALAGVRTDLSSQTYLGGDGFYHTMPTSCAPGHLISSNGVGLPQRCILDFSDIFVLTDDLVNNTTNVSINPNFLPNDIHVQSGVYNSGSEEIILTLNDGSQVIVDVSGIGGGAAEDYVVAGNYNIGTNTITLTRLLGGTVSFQLTGLATTDELVKVGAAGTARYLGLQDFFDSGIEILVRKQMSIVSDAAGLRLDGDVLTPADNTVYGKRGGVKGWYPDTGTEVSVTGLVNYTGAYVFNHNLNKRPNIVCEGAAPLREWFFPAIRTIDANSVEITFSSPFTGTIYAN